jgi:hypothetical protein
MFPYHPSISCSTQGSYCKYLRNYFPVPYTKIGAHGSVVGCGTMLQVGMSQIRVPKRQIIFLNLSIPCSSIMTLGVFAASNRNEYQKIFLESRMLTAHKVEKLTAIYELIVRKMWDP